MQTEIGKIQDQIIKAAEEEEDTPLKQKINRFGELLAQVNTIRKSRQGASAVGSGHLLHLCDGLAHQLSPLPLVGAKTRKHGTGLVHRALLRVDMHLLLQDCGGLGGRGDSGRSAGCHHNLPGAGDAPHGEEESTGAQAAVGGDPRLYHSHLLGQDRNVDDESDVVCTNDHNGTHSGDDIGVRRGGTHLQSFRRVHRWPQRHQLGASGECDVCHDRPQMTWAVVL